MEFDDYRTSWQHKVKKNLTATQPYYWCDRVLIIDEAAGRLVLDDITRTEFNKQMEEWELTEQPRNKDLLKGLFDA